MSGIWRSRRVYRVRMKNRLHGTICALKLRRRELWAHVKATGKGYKAMFRVMHSYYTHGDTLIDECIATYDTEAEAVSHALRLASIGYNAWVQNRS